MRHHHSVRREGLISGGLAALTVALWFLLVDVINGRPLYTPSVLGQILLLGAPTAVTDKIDTVAVGVYTAFHFAAFALFGLIVTKLVHLAVNVPVIRFGIVMLFIVFEVFFWGFTYLFFEQTRGLFPRGSILVANTLAAVVMASYLWHRHPTLKRALKHEALGS